MCLQRGIKLLHLISVRFEGVLVAASLIACSATPAPAPPVALGPRGPFPQTPLSADLERRWLHYAFLSRDHQWCLVANTSWLGPVDGHSDAGSRRMTILLVHHRATGWRASQFNAHTSDPAWSSFRLPHGTEQAGRLTLGATDEQTRVELALTRSSRPCTSQCAPLGKSQHFRWQSEAGVLARGNWRFDGTTHREIEAVGYHERVRGHWDWHDLGGWVFGFANDTSGPANRPPPAALVFTLIQPRDEQATTGSVMLWCDGRFKRHFPRRQVSAAVRGKLDRDRVVTTPALARLLGTDHMAPIPRQLIISAQAGRDHVILEFESESAARIIIPSETGLTPFSVHEVYGPCRVHGMVGQRRIDFSTCGIVEFAGGASVD